MVISTYLPHTARILSEMLDRYEGSMGIEIVAINGEDHNIAAGEVDHLKRYGKDLNKVVLVVNVDGIGMCRVTPLG